MQSIHSRDLERVVGYMRCCPVIEYYLPQILDFPFFLYFEK